MVNNARNYWYYRIHSFQGIPLHNVFYYGGDDRVYVYEGEFPDYVEVGITQNGNVPKILIHGHQFDYDEFLNHCRQIAEVN
jgi:hypothetical protein